jgi:nucleotide-binding universal stress UspA family protein
VSQPILVGYDPESGNRNPVDFAAEAGRLTGAPLVVAVVHPSGSPPEPLAGVDAELRLIEHGSPAHALAAAIDEVRRAMVVLGSASGHGVLGSTTDRVIHQAACPVAVVPHGYVRPAAGLRTIGAAFAPTPEGREALGAAATLARAFGAGVRVVTVLSPKHVEEQSGLLARQHHDLDAAEVAAGREDVEAEQTMRDAIAELAGDVEVETDVLFQEPAHGLVAASANLDLLLMGSRARGPLRSIALGSVSRQVTAAASCPVIVLPRGTEGALDALVAEINARR